MSIFDHLFLTILTLLCALGSYAVGSFLGSAAGNAALPFRIGLGLAFIFIIIAIGNWWL